MHSWPVSHVRLEVMKKAADKDLVMREATKFTVDGRLTKSGNISRDLHGLYSLRSNLSMAEGLLVYDGRIVIPSTLQSEILEVIPWPSRNYQVQRKSQRSRLVVWHW